MIKIRSRLAWLGILMLALVACGAESQSPPPASGEYTDAEFVILLEGTTSTEVPDEFRSDVAGFGHAICSLLELDTRTSTEIAATVDSDLFDAKTLVDASILAFCPNED